MTSSAASSAGVPAAAAASAASTIETTWSREDALRVTDPDAVPSPAPAKETTVTEMPCITPLVVRVLLAQRRLALVESRTMTTHASAREAFRACSTRSCGVGAGMGVPYSSEPASAVVLSTRTSRNSAVGAPCETEATCPGCALPQLKAPSRTQVCGPPTASIEFQKSVVVAW